METLARGAETLGLALSPHQRELFETYYRELVEWNQRLNLTTIVDYREVQTRHFVDSISVALALGPGAGRVIDIGTGAGFPGLPLIILLPHLEVVLLESVPKKTAFLSHLIVRLGLQGVEVLTARAEEVAHRPKYRESFDAVLGRALAPLAVMAELALPLARTGGRVISQKKGDFSAEAALAARAISLMGGRVAEIREVAAPGLEGHRLVVLEKVSPTPKKYPRRAGMPAKRPIM